MVVTVVVVVSPVAVGVRVIVESIGARMVGEV
jgi:hypothetical protein